MTAVLKKTSYSNSDKNFGGTVTEKTSAPPQRRPQAIHTVGELALQAGLDQEPVVRKWQNLIQAAVAEHDPDRYLQRWNQRRSISLVTLASLLSWLGIAAAAFSAL